MAISIDWATQVISVPKADLSLVSAGPPEIRSLDTDQFRKDLNALQAGENGMPEPTTHIHTAPVTLGGVTFARQVEIVNGYTVTFEDGAYAVNLSGSNNNISDVVNLNSVSIRSSNSAGLTFSQEILDMWRLQGLEIGNAMTVTPTTRKTANLDVDQVISGDGVNTTTVDRQ